MPVNCRKIAELREGKMLTMKEAASRAGMSSRQRWYAIESGLRTNITPDTLYAVARALGVTMDELMTQSAEEGPPKKVRRPRKKG